MPLDIPTKSQSTAVRLKSTSKRFTQLTRVTVEITDSAQIHSLVTESTDRFHHHTAATHHAKIMNIVVTQSTHPLTNVHPYTPLPAHSTHPMHHGTGLIVGLQVATSSVVRSYDLVAVRPTTEKLFHQCCQQVGCSYRHKLLRLSNSQAFVRVRRVGGTCTRCLCLFASRAFASQAEADIISLDFSAKVGDSPLHHC